MLDPKPKTLGKFLDLQLLYQVVAISAAVLFSLL